MSMTNAERQARWRDRLRAKAAGQSFEDAMRAKMRELAPKDWGAFCFDDDADVADAKAALDAMLAMTDKELEDWFFECAFGDPSSLHDTFLSKLYKDRAAAEKAEKRKTGRRVKAVTNA
jgi:hypothetical protein